MEAMGDRLRQARKQAGFRSARSAAVRFGWSPSTYAAHENGQNGFDAETAAVYAWAFKSNASWLLLGNDHRARPVVIIVAGLAIKRGRIEKNWSNAFLFKADNNYDPVSENIILLDFECEAFPSQRGIVVQTDDFKPKYEKGDLIILSLKWSEKESQEIIYRDETGDVHFGRVVNIVGLDEDDCFRLDLLDFDNKFRSRVAVEGMWTVYMVIKRPFWRFAAEYTEKSVGSIK